MRSSGKLNPLYIVLVLLLIVAMLVLILTGRTDSGNHGEYEVSMAALTEGAKDFALDQDQFVSTSDDPWLDVEIPRGRYSQLILDVSSLSKPSTTCAVYYCLTESGGYSEDQCVTAELSEQSVTIDLPGNEIDRVRLDLTDEKDVSIALDRVLLIAGEDPKTGRTVAVAVCGLLLALLLFAIIGGQEKTAADTRGKRGIVGGCSGRIRSLRVNLGLEQLSATEKYYLLLCFIVYAFWMLTFVSVNYGPDEYMRYQVPEFIYLNNALPKGWEESIRNPTWGVSYGFDISLPYLLSAAFMKIASLFSRDGYVLLMAARLPSALSMVGVGYFSILFSKKILGRNPMRWVFIVLMTLLPQFVFLSSYVNLDPFSLFTVMMIVYSWVICLEQRWSIPATGMLAVALGLCFLSYKFAYSYILMTVPLYCAWHIMNHRQTSFKAFLLKGMLIMGIAFAICGWKFIRSAILYDGDFLSLHASRPYAELYAMEEFKPSVKKSLFEQGYSLGYMLREMSWMRRTCQSFVGVFGYMKIYLPKFYYSCYYALVIVGGAGALCLGVISLVRRKRGTWTADVGLIAASMILASLVTLGISVYYSWTSDFQAQGRYIIAVAPMVFMGVTLGLNQWIATLCAIPAFRRIKRENIQVLCTVIVVSFVLLSLFAGTMACLEAFGYPGQVPSWV